MAAGCRPTEKGRQFTGRRQAGNPVKFDPWQRSTRLRINILGLAAEHSQSQSIAFPAFGKAAPDFRQAINHIQDRLILALITDAMHRDDIAHKVWLLPAVHYNLRDT